MYVYVCLFVYLNVCMHVYMCVCVHWQVARIIAGGEKGGYAGAPPGLYRAQKKQKRDS